MATKVRRAPLPGLPDQVRRCAKERVREKPNERVVQTVDWRQTCARAATLKASAEHRMDENTAEKKPREPRRHSMDENTPVRCAPATVAYDIACGTAMTPTVRPAITSRIKSLLALYAGNHCNHGKVRLQHLRATDCTQMSHQQCADLCPDLPPIQSPSSLPPLGPSRSAQRAEEPNLRPGGGGRLELRRFHGYQRLLHRQACGVFRRRRQPPFEDPPTGRATY